MPEALQQRFLSRLKTAETAHSRRLRLIISGAAAGIVLTTGLVFTLVRGHLRAGEASQAAIAITDLLELGELDRAGDFVKTLEKADPGLLAYPTTIEARQRFEAAQAKESAATAPVRQGPARGGTGSAGDARAEGPRRCPARWPGARPRNRRSISSSSSGGLPSRPNATSKRWPSGHGSKR